ncbi:MAG: hypothetical protein HY913_03665 [Desulfomonile tiedjei]|nr:hypothetical protein [Desulfomonile tiedjei]
MQKQDQSHVNESGSEFGVGPFKPEDAKGIVSLFRSVYGEGYPIRVFYDEEKLTEANAAGQYYSIVARNPTGQVVGVQHLFRSAPYPNLYEAGAGLVDRDYRKLGLISEMLRFAFEGWVPQQSNIEETFGEAVCNHTHMQKTVSSLAHVETALEVALMPAEAYDAEQSAKGRVAALLVFRRYKPKPHTVFLPRQYEKELRFIYSALDDTRNFEAADQDLPRDQPSRAEMTVFDFAKVARIAMHATGFDLEPCLENLENQARDQKAVVFQVWLKLNSPWVGSAVDILRRRGYYVGGILPRWFDEDGLLMQKLFVDPNFDDIQLHSDRAKEILAIVKQDRERAQQMGGACANKC